MLACTLSLPERAKILQAAVACKSKPWWQYARRDHILQKWEADIMRFLTADACLGAPHVPHPASAGMPWILLHCGAQTCNPQVRLNASMP